MKAQPDVSSNTAAVAANLSERMMFVVTNEANCGLAVADYSAVAGSANGKISV